MTAYKIKFVGPATLAIDVATALADADGVELISSATPSAVDEHTVDLNFSAEGTRDDVTAAVSSIGDTLPDGATIEVAAE